jgi:hypothetical protein
VIVIFRLVTPILKSSARHRAWLDTICRPAFHFGADLPRRRSPHLIEQLLKAFFGPSKSTTFCKPKLLHSKYGGAISLSGRNNLRGRLWGHDKRLSRPERAKCATARLTIVIARLRIVFTRSARILHQSRPVVILADTRPGAPEIMFGIEHMGLPVGQSAESLGEVGKFALGYARAAPVGMLLAGLFDKAVLP